MTNLPDKSHRSEILLYQTEDGKIKIDVRFQEETVWLSQKLMAELFQTTKQNISLHVKRIYEEGELSPEATVKQFLTVQIKGGRSVRRSHKKYKKPKREKRSEIEMVFWGMYFADKDCRRKRLTTDSLIQTQQTASAVCLKQGSLSEAK